MDLAKQWALDKCPQGTEATIKIDGAQVLTTEPQNCDSGWSTSGKKPCQPWSRECNTNEYESISPTSTQDRTCVYCPNGVNSSGNGCVADAVVSAGSTTGSTGSTGSTAGSTGSTAGSTGSTAGSTGSTDGASGDAQVLTTEPQNCETGWSNNGKKPCASFSSPTPGKYIHTPGTSVADNIIVDCTLITNASGVTCTSAYDSEPTGCNIGYKRDGNECREYKLEDCPGQKVNSDATGCVDWEESDCSALGKVWLEGKCVEVLYTDRDSYHPPHGVFVNMDRTETPETGVISNHGSCYNTSTVDEAKQHCNSVLNCGGFWRYSDSTTKKERTCFKQPLNQTLNSGWSEPNTGKKISGDWEGNYYENSRSFVQADGCMDATAFNYNPYANTDDKTCKGKCSNYSCPSSPENAIATRNESVVCAGENCSDKECCNITCSSNDYEVKINKWDGCSETQASKDRKILAEERKKACDNNNYCDNWGCKTGTVMGQCCKNGGLRSGTTCIAPPVDCKLATGSNKWGAYGACSPGCGTAKSISGGRKTRKQRIEVQPKNGGKSCPTLQTNTNNCFSTANCANASNTDYCPGWDCHDRKAGQICWENGKKAYKCRSKFTMATGLKWEWVKI